MEFDLKQIGEWLMAKDLMAKPFQEFSEEDITELCKQIHQATQCPGYRIPWIDRDGTLVIPSDTHPKYKWWDKGQKIILTLEELDVPEEIKKKYIPKWKYEAMAEIEGKKSESESTVYRTCPVPDDAPGDTAPDRVGRLGVWGRDAQPEK